MSSSEPTFQNEDDKYDDEELVMLIDIQDDYEELRNNMDDDAMNNHNTTTMNNHTDSNNNSHSPLLPCNNGDNIDIDIDIDDVANANADANEDEDEDEHHGSLRTILPTLAISIALGLVSGTLYGFGRYARTLKEVLNLSQSQVQTLGICMDCGNYVGHPLTGLIYDRKGPIVSCLAAAMIVSTSYWRIRWTVLNHHHQKQQQQYYQDEELSESASLWLNLAFCGVGFGSGLGYISGLGSATKALLSLSSKGSSSKFFGTGIGLVAASYGLSSTLVGISYMNLPDLPSFFLFWAIIVAPVNLIAAFMFKRQQQQKARNAEALQASHFPSEPTLSRLLSVASTSSMNLALPIAETLSNHQQLLTGPSLSRLLSFASTSKMGEQVGLDTTDRIMDSSEDEEAIFFDEDAALPMWDSWKKLEFWLLFTAFSCVTGCGLMVINNLSTMVQSMGGSDWIAGTLIIVLSLSNVSGRILLGILGDSATSTSAVLRRIELLQGVNLTMAMAMFMGCLGGQHTVFLAVLVILVAIAYGGSWVLIVALISHLFGKDHFGKDYGLLALGPALSGMIFNKASARWYEEHAFDNTCIGRECYETSYLAAGLVALMGYGVTLSLYKIRQRKEQYQEL